MGLTQLSNSDPFFMSNASPEMVPPSLVTEKSRNNSISHCQLPSIDQIFGVYPLYPSYTSYTTYEDHHYHQRKSSMTSNSDSDYQIDILHRIPKTVKDKRKRANPTQIYILNQVFQTTAFPSTQLRNQLGAQLKMSPRAIQIWFQNKRQHLKGRLPHGSREAAKQVALHVLPLETSLLPFPNSYTSY